MKLFVWNCPISVSYGGTCLYVVADSLREARKVAEKALISRYGSPPKDAPGKDSPPFDKPLGKPDRVIKHAYPVKTHKRGDLLDVEKSRMGTRA